MAGWETAKVCILLKTLWLISQSSAFSNLFLRFLAPFWSWEGQERCHKNFRRDAPWMRCVELKMKDQEQTDPFGSPSTVPSGNQTGRTQNRILTSHPRESSFMDVPIHFYHTQSLCLCYLIRLGQKGHFFAGQRSTKMYTLFKKIWTTSLRKRHYILVHIKIKSLLLIWNTVKETNCWNVSGMSI